MQFQLNSLLNTTTWNPSKFPFDYIHVKNVFKQDFYYSLHNAYTNYLTEEFTNLKNSIQFHELAKTQNNFIFGLNRTSAVPFHVFFSEEWHNLLTHYFDAEYTKDINVAIHYRRKNSMETWIHNDLNPGWFPSNNEFEINLADNEKCDYQTGKTTDSSIVATKRVRSLAMIFYINNPPIASMEGGGTGLYSSPKQNINNPTVVIPPENNSMLLFPCTPSSFHAFVTNKSHQRCSIIMWFHSPLDYVVSKWGTNSIVDWR